MRVPLLIAAAVALASCGKNDQAGTAQNLDETLTANSIVSNDVTAIDAVTGDAANMAADVDMNFGNLDQGSEEFGNDARPSRPAASKPQRAKSAVPAESNSTTPETTTGNAE